MVDPPNCRLFSGRSWAQAENSPLRDWLRVARREVVEALGRPAPSSRADRRAAPPPRIAPRQYLSRSCAYLWKCTPILRGVAGSDDGLDERHAAQHGRDARYERRGAAGRASARSVGAHPRGEVTPMKAPSPPPTMPNLILLTAEDSSPEAGGGRHRFARSESEHRKPRATGLSWPLADFVNAKWSIDHGQNRLDDQRSVAHDL